MNRAPAISLHVDTHSLFRYSWLPRLSLFAHLVVEVLALDPDLVSVELLRRAKLNGDGGGKTVLDATQPYLSRRSSRRALTNIRLQRGLEAVTSAHVRSKPERFRAEIVYAWFGFLIFFLHALGVWSLSPQLTLRFGSRRCAVATHTSS